MDTPNAMLGLFKIFSEISLTILTKEVEEIEQTQKIAGQNLFSVLEIFEDHPLNKLLIFILTHRLL